MYPRLWELGSFAVPSYWALMMLGYLAGSITALILARGSGVRVWHVVILCSAAMFMGLVGSFGLQKLVQISQHLDDPERWLSLKGGRAFLGGPLLVVPFLLCYTTYFRLPFIKLADVGAPVLAIGAAFGRVGCFLAGCCYGQPTSCPLGVCFISRTVPAALRDLPLHPTQLYESAGLLLIFALLLWL